MESTVIYNLLSNMSDIVITDEERERAMYIIERYRFFDEKFEKLHKRTSSFREELLALKESPDNEENNKKADELQANLKTTMDEYDSVLIEFTEVMNEDKKFEKELVEKYGPKILDANYLKLNIFNKLSY